MRFAAYDTTSSVIWGIGNTESDARREAEVNLLAWFGNEEEVEEAMLDLEFAPCTPELEAKSDNDGGEFSFELIDGVLALPKDES